MISVIIPAFNAEKYIDRCIKSILNQTYKDLEIIVVNDGSIDSTELICSKYLEYKNFKLINKKNEGPSIARKTGLDIASGEYVSFIDSDDYLDENFYEVMIDELSSKNVDIVECGYKFVDEDGVILNEANMHSEYIENDCVKHYVLKKNTTNYLWNKIFKIKLFENIIFPKFYAGEDACVLLQLFSKATKISVITNNMYNYVQTASSLCRKPYNLKKNDSVRAGIFMYDYCKKNHEHLADYYASYICINAVICYSQLKYSNIDNKVEYMNEMKDIFDKYLIMDKFKKLEISKYRKIFIQLFSVSPCITSFIYKKVLKK